MKKVSQIAVLAVMLVMTLVFTPCCANEPDDNGPPKSQTYYLDNDGDGYGDANQTISAVNMPAGYSDEGGDCNDNDPSIHPGASEPLCSLEDKNCDGDLGPQSTKLYSLDEYDGFIGISSHYFDSSSQYGVPIGNGIFTFDITDVDWSNVQTAEINAYMTNDWPCQEGDWFLTPAYRINSMPDEYYSYLQECPGGVYAITNCSNSDEFNCYCLQQLWENTIVINYLSPLFYSDNSIQTTNWWKVNVYNQSTENIWLEAFNTNKEYISITPTTFPYMCFDPASNYPYRISSTDFPYYEDAGNYRNTGNLPYLEVTCQP